MDQAARVVYRFGAFAFDAGTSLLWRRSELVSLTPKAASILCLLLQQSGSLVAKEELVRRVWPDAFVEEANLSHHIYKIREALGPDGGPYIETVPRRGYRFVAPVTIEHADGQKAPSRSFAARPTPQSIAVLPFRTLAAADRDEALELGMANALVTRLSRFEDLIVRPTSAILKYAGTDDPIVAGREQGVDAVIDATLQQAVGRIRVTVQLLRVADARLLWAGTFDESADDVFALQDSMSMRVAAALPVTSSRSEPVRETSSIPAYEAFLKGSYHAMTFAPGGFEKAVEHLRRAIDLDPQYARAYGALAFAYAGLPTIASVSARVPMEQAISYASRALALDERVLEAHMALCNVNLYYRWNPAEAERECRRLIELSPRAPVGYHFLGWHLSLMGRFEDALRWLREARRLDPQSLLIRGATLSNRLWARDFVGAAAEAEGILEFDPSNGYAIDGLANLRQLEGRFDEAIALLERAPIPDVLRLGALGHAYGRARRSQQALHVIRNLQNGAADCAYDASFALAEIYGALGEFDSAFAALERAVEVRNPLLAWAKVEPRLDALRTDARFHGLLQRIGFVPNQ